MAALMVCARFSASRKERYAGSQRPSRSPPSSQYRASGKSARRRSFCGCGKRTGSAGPACAPAGHAHAPVHHATGVEHGAPIVGVEEVASLSASLHTPSIDNAGARVLSEARSHLENGNESPKGSRRHGTEAKAELDATGLEGRTLPMLKQASPRQAGEIPFWRRLPAHSRMMSMPAKN